MIDARNGSIVFEGPAYRISADLTPSRYLGSPLAAVGGGLPSARFAFQPVTWGGELVAGNLCFEGGVLAGVQLQVIRAEFGTSWADATEEKELARKHVHETLAARALGAPLEVLVAHPRDPRCAMLGRSYPWGSVRSYYDAKGGFSTLEVQYLIEGRRP